MYYNRFRYYSPESGIYISQDPIKLAGNNQSLYAYVPNTNIEIDVYGLVHGLETSVTRNGQTIFSETYTSGGMFTGMKPNQQQALLTHTERKFLNDINDLVNSGDHLKMVGQLNPCKPGCQPAIRDFVADKGVTAEYFASDTKMHYIWEKTGNNKVLQIETDITTGKVSAYEYDTQARRRNSVNLDHKH